MTYFEIDMQLLYSRGFKLGLIAANSQHFLRSYSVTSKVSSRSSCIRVNIRGRNTVVVGYALGGKYRELPIGSLNAWESVRRRLQDRYQWSCLRHKFRLHSKPHGGREESGSIQEICLEVSGLKCGSCVAKLECVLSSIESVVKVRVNQVF